MSYLIHRLLEFLCSCLFLTSNDRGLEKRNNKYIKKCYENQVKLKTYIHERVATTHYSNTRNSFKENWPIHSSSSLACVQMPPNSLDSRVQMSPNSLDSRVHMSPNSLDLCVQMSPNSLDSHVQMSPNSFDSRVQTSPNSFALHVRRRLHAG